VNVALPAVIVILGLLPGIIFFHGYFAGRFVRQVAGLAGISEFALYILFAVPLDAFAHLVSRSLGRGLDVSLIAGLLVNAPTAAMGERLAASMQRNLGVAIAIYIGTLAASLALAVIARRFVWASRLDLRFNVLRMKHDWYYLLLGRVKGKSPPTATWVDVMSHVGNEIKLYQGIVQNFEPDSDGKLSRLHLMSAQRGSGRGNEFIWKPIPGDYFVINGETIRSINVRYISIQPITPEKPPKFDAIRRWVRRFWYEEI
jgi:hypothetical protein